LLGGLRGKSIIWDTTVFDALAFGRTRERRKARRRQEREGSELDYKETCLHGKQIKGRQYMSRPKREIGGPRGGGKLTEMSPKCASRRSVETIQTGNAKCDIILK